MRLCIAARGGGVLQRIAPRLLAPPSSSWSAARRKSPARTGRRCRSGSARSRASASAMALLDLVQEPLLRSPAKGSVSDGAERSCCPTPVRSRGRRCGTFPGRRSTAARWLCSSGSSGFARWRARNSAMACGIFEIVEMVVAPFDGRVPGAASPATRAPVRSMDPRSPRPCHPGSRQLRSRAHRACSATHRVGRSAASLSSGARNSGRPRLPIAMATLRRKPAIARPRHRACRGTSRETRSSVSCRQLLERRSEMARLERRVAGHRRAPVPGADVLADVAAEDVAADARAHAPPGPHRAARW